MNPKLRNLLVAVGVSFVGATAYTLYTPANGVQKGDLIDAGIFSDGVQKEALCRVWCESDGGIAYRYQRTPGALFNTDKGFVSSAKFITPGCHPFTTGDLDGGKVFDCKPAPTQTLGAGVDEADDPEECACSPIPAGTCEQLYPDGGWGAPTPKMTFNAGQWRNGCVTKPCKEIAGGSSWPTACGPE